MRFLIWATVFVIFMKPAFSLSAEGILRGLRLKDEQARWQIRANKMSYLEKEGLYVVEGDVVISRGRQVLSAEKATYNERTGIVKVSGSFRLEANGDLLTGESGTFDLKGQTGQIIKGRLFVRDNHYYVSGDLVERIGPNTYRVEGGRLTTCDGDKPDWSITGSKVEITMEGYGKVKHVTFRIRDVPVFYVPYAVFPVKTKRQTGLLPPRIGYSGRNGLDAEVPFFWAISEQADATLYERYMGQRGFMQGLEFRHVAEHDSKGIYLFDVLSDRIEKKDLNLPEDAQISPFPRTNKTRYWLRSRTDQQFPRGLAARLDTDFVSDQDYQREFLGGLFGREARPDLVREFGRPVEEIQSATRRSALRLSYDKEAYSLQAASTYNQRPENPPNDETPQPFGAVRFSLLPRPLTHLPLFFGFNTDYDYIWRDEGQKGHGVSFTPEVSYPMFLSPHVEFEPSISYTGNTRWVDNPLEKDEQHSGDAYRLRARLSTVLERIFDFQWKDVKKLKHKLTPRFDYTFRASDDGREPRPWFEPIDSEGKIHRIAFSLENILDARKENEKGEVTYTQWGTLDLSQGYSIDEARREALPGRERRPFEPLMGELSLTPFPDLHMDAEAHWDHEEDEISFADLSLELALPRSGDRKDRFDIDYQFVRGETENITYYVNLNLFYGFSVGTSLKRDIKLRQDISSSYWLEYQSQCWTMRLTAGRLDEVSSIMLTFRLVGFGGV